VLLLADPVDSFWVSSGASFDGKPFKSITHGSADLGLIPLLDTNSKPSSEIDKSVTAFLSFIKAELGDAVSDVRPSDRLMDSAVCLIAPESGPDRQLEKLLAGAGRLKAAAKPVLEVNPHHSLIKALASLGDDEHSFKQDVAHCWTRHGSWTEIGRKIQESLATDWHMSLGEAWPPPAYE